MTILFKAKTDDGFTIKILAELLQNTIKTACLEINKNDISLRMMDARRTLLLDIHLYAVKFNIYEMASDETLYIGLNLSHLFRMLKSIKKKDSLSLTLGSDDLTKLFIRIHPKENNRIITSCINIQNIQNVDIPLPLGYDNPIVIPSEEYQRTLKDMNNISNSIFIRVRKYSICIYCLSNDIYYREVQFGQLDDNTPIVYEDEFDKEQLINIIKISGLSKNLQFYARRDLPLLIQSNVGELGIISVYIKSKLQIQMEGNDI
jgi:proliferating cell nuclear antigen PCNA